MKKQFTVRQFADSDADKWDAFLHACPKGTFLHSRRFLSYHGDRFADRSLMIYDDKGALCGLLPAARHPNPDQSDVCIVSHPGITYGGILHNDGLTGNAMLSALEAIAKHYMAAGYKHLIYKAVPQIFHRKVQEDDIYALLRMGATLAEVNLSSAVDLNLTPRGISKGHIKNLKRARQAGIRIIDGRGHIEEIWHMIADNLAQKYNVVPTHSLAELKLLADRFSYNILFRAAFSGDGLVGGGVLFIINHVCHAQYLTSNPQGREIYAMNALVDSIMGEMAGKYRWFSFGISNESGGGVLNDSLHEFKIGFGAGGIATQFYKLEFSANADLI